MAAEPVRSTAVPFFLPESWQPNRLPQIMSIVCRHTEDQWPPFVDSWYGDRYREFALDPDWLAHSFVANADKEADGARKLWKIAGEARSFPFAESIRVHAIDEARHARMYVAMLDLTFPGSLSRSDTAALTSAYPTYDGQKLPTDIPERSIQSLIDDIIQMNIGEIRTRIHQMLLKPVALAVAPEGNHTKLGSMIANIYADEGRHIIYTAGILESYCSQGFYDEISMTYSQRLKDFSRLTLQEVGLGNFD